jgi:hypothetical protein
MNVNNISNLIISKYIIMDKEFVTSRTNPCKLFSIFSSDYTLAQIQIKWLAMQAEKNESVYFKFKWENKDLTQVKNLDQASKINGAAPRDSMHHYRSNSW